MKFHKFRGLARRYSWLADIVDPQCVLRSDENCRTAPDRMSLLRDYVRNKLVYIMFLDWHELPHLDTPQGTVLPEETFEEELLSRSAPSFNERVEEWMVVWKGAGSHVEVCPHWGGCSLNETMDEIEKDDVSKSTFLVAKTTTMTYPGAVEKTKIEIYQLPPYRIGRQIIIEQSSKVSEYDQRSYSAYMAGEAMPPIMPGKQLV